MTDRIHNSHSLCDVSANGLIRPLDSDYSFVDKPQRPTLKLFASDGIIVWWSFDFIAYADLIRYEMRIVPQLRPECPSHAAPPTGDPKAHISIFGAPNRFLILFRICRSKMWVLLKQIENSG